MKETVEVQFDAFISYAHEDASAARSIQLGLERFGRKWLRRRALHVFRDTSTLPVSTALWPPIIDAMRASSWFLLLASAASAESRYVEAEVRWWLENKGPESLLLVVVDSEAVGPLSCAEGLEWLPLPPSAKFVLSQEPRFLDLRWVRNWDAQTLVDKRYTDAIAELSAAIQGRRKDELIGEDLAEQRRMLIRARQARGALLLTLVAAICSAVVAYRWYLEAVARGATSEAGRLAALGRQSLGEGNVDRALLLAASAQHAASTDGGVGLITEVLSQARGVSRLYTGHTQQVWSVALNSRDETIASGGGDGSVRVWSTDTGGEVARLLGHDAIVEKVAYHPTRSILASGDKSGRLLLWDTDTFSLLRGPVPLSDSGVTALAFTPDGQFIATGTGDGAIELRETSTLEVVPTIATPIRGKPIHDIAFSRDGRFMALPGGDFAVHVWEVFVDTLTLSSKPLCVLPSTQGHPPWAATFVGESHILLYVDLGGTIRTCEVSTTCSVQDFPLFDQTRIYGVASNSSGTEIALALHDGRVLAFDPANWELLYSDRLHRLGAHSIDYGSTESLLVSGGGEGMIGYRNLKRSQIGKQYADGITSLSIAGGRNGPQVMAVASRDGSLDIYDGRQLVRELRGMGADPTLDVRLSDDGVSVIAVKSSGSVEKWESGEWRVVYTPTRENLPLLGADIGPEGRALVVIDSAHDAWLVEDVAQGGYARRIPSDGRAFSARFSYDGAYLALGLDRGHLTVWSVSPFRVVGRRSLPASGSIRSVAFNPDGRLLAAGVDLGRITPLGEPVQPEVDRGPIFVWRWHERGSLRKLFGHGEAVLSLNFLPDGDSLASASWDGEVRLWTGIEDDAKSVRLGKSGRGIHELVASGDRVYTGGSANVVEVWYPRAEQWTERACLVANRDFSDEEQELLGVPPAGDGACRGALK